MLGRCSTDANDCRLSGGMHFCADFGLVARTTSRAKKCRRRHSHLGHGSPKHDFMGRLMKSWEEGFGKFQPNVRIENKMLRNSLSHRRFIRRRG